MSGYIEKSIQKFQHLKPKQPQHDPPDWTIPAYGSKVQYAHTKPELTTLEPSGTQQVQSIMSNLLYYSRAVYPTMISALKYISIQQSKPTAHNINKYNHLLDYAATYPNVVIRYHASGMIIHSDTNDACIVLPKYLS